MPTDAAATILAMASLPHPVSPRTSPGTLVDQLLDYARGALGADHAVLFEYDSAARTVSNRVCNGSFTPYEVSAVGRSGPRADYPSTPADIAELAEPTVLDRRAPSTGPGMRAYLERIGSERALVLPVPFDSPNTLFLEVHYRRRDAVLSPALMAEAQTFAPMLGA